MRVLRWVAAVVVLILLGLGVVAWRSWRTGLTENTSQTKFDVILVLGTPCRKDGTPSPEQRERVLEGIREWQKGVAPRLVMSGGAAHNQWVEADCMAALARSRGVPAEDILEDRQAQNTVQNVYYTNAIMQAHGWHSTEVVSSWSHLPRAGLILQHFPLAWRTHAAPWPKEYWWWKRALIDWNEAQYTMKLRKIGFRPSPFLPSATRTADSVYGAKN